ncbi:MAG: type IV pilus assembly protein PilF [Lentisphaeria bacterium]|jgi:type IV pilus assembly protein PilF
MTKKFFSTFASALTLLLVGCVTTMDKPGKKIDKKRALEANVKLGMAYLEQNQRDDALRAFTNAIELDSISAEAHQGMALIHQTNGEMDHAEVSFKRALKSRSDFSRSGIEFSYGRFLMMQNRCEEALSFFEKVSKDFNYTNRAQALFNIGYCAEKLNDRVRATASYEYALNVNKRFRAAALELAHIKFEDKDYVAAKKYLDTFSANSRQSARSLWLGIRLERVFGNQDKEASYALALKNLHPYSQEYLEYKRILESTK